MLALRPLRPRNAVAKRGLGKDEFACLTASALGWPNAVSGARASARKPQCRQYLARQRSLQSFGSLAVRRAREAKPLPPDRKAGVLGVSMALFLGAPTSITPPGSMREAGADDATERTHECSKGPPSWAPSSCPPTRTVLHLRPHAIGLLDKRIIQRGLKWPQLEPLAPSPSICGTRPRSAAGRTSQPA